MPAEIRWADRSVRVKLRLKGDLPDHLEGDKWSFRIHTRDGNAIMGMRRFSIQAPKTRGFQVQIRAVCLNAHGINSMHRAHNFNPDTSGSRPRMTPWGVEAASLNLETP